MNINIKGFSTEDVTATWVICEECGDSELVYGSFAETDAIAWAEDHHQDHKRTGPL